MEYKYILKRLGVISVAKLYGLLFGLIYGIIAIITGINLIMADIVTGGVLLIILGPIASYLLGFVFSIIFTWFLNLFLKMSGGVELYMEKE